jgi:hypothetical protein
MKKRTGNKGSENKGDGKKIRRTARRKRILRRLTKFHGAVTAGFLLIYLLTALFTDPRFLIRDFKDKFAQAANVTATLRIYGPPEKPVVTATTDCDNTSPYVNLDWNDTTDTDNYDLNRNALPLITGLTDSEYSDENVNRETSYTYQVIANGPLGNTASDDVIATTGECPEQEDATCTIRTMNGKKISSYSGTPQINDQTPKFTGTTNIENADIDIRVESETIISASTTANDNGYWSWTTTEDLDFGSHKIRVTATDPDDESYSETDNLTFKVVPEETAVPLPPAPPSPPIQPPQETPPSAETPQEPEALPPPPPVEMSLEVKNPEITVYSGRDLETETIIKNTDGTKKDLVITYVIYDSNDNIISTNEVTVTLENDRELSNAIKIPRLAKPGKYRIEAKIRDGDNIISDEKYFEIKEVPLINLGSGMTMTLTQIMQKISWTIIILSLILLFFLILLGYEHRLAKKALFHITENILKSRDIFTPH